MKASPLAWDVVVSTPPAAGMLSQGFLLAMCGKHTGLLLMSKVLSKAVVKMSSSHSFLWAGTTLRYEALILCVHINTHTDMAGCLPPHDSILYWPVTWYLGVSWFNASQQLIPTQCSLTYPCGMGERIRKIKLSKLMG